MENSNLVLKLRTNQNVSRWFVGFIFLFNIYAMLDLLFFNESFLKTLQRFRMFTNISNIIIFVVVGLFLLGKKDKKWFKYLSVIGLVAILMTGIIYHALLREPNMDFQNHTVHTINPIFYALFYYLLIDKPIKLYHFWVSLILPILYFGIILLLGPWTNWYPYGFMNPTLEGQSLQSVLIFCLVLLLPVISIFTFGLLSLKVYLEKVINK